jgi:hypothetical protein
MIGLAPSVALSRAVQGLLFDINAFDPQTLLAVAAGMIVVRLFARRIRPCAAIGVTRSRRGPATRVIPLGRAVVAPPSMSAPRSDQVIGFNEAKRSQRIPDFIRTQQAPAG